MTDYATHTDVEKRIPDIILGGNFSTTTFPKAADVDEWIDQHEGEINSILNSHGYVNPVVTGDDPQAFDWVKGAVISRACVEVINTKPGVAFDPDGNVSQSDRKALFWNTWQRLIEMIEAETFKATRNVTRSETFVVGSAKNSSSQIKDPVFSRDMWDYPGGPGARGRTSSP